MSPEQINNTVNQLPEAALHALQKLLNIFEQNQIQPDERGRYRLVIRQKEKSIVFLINKDCTFKGFEVEDETKNKRVLNKSKAIALLAPFNQPNVIEGGKLKQDKSGNQYLVYEPVQAESTSSRDERIANLRRQLGLGLSRGSAPADTTDITKAVLGALGIDQTEPDSKPVPPVPPTPPPTVPIARIELSRDTPFGLPAAIELQDGTE